MSYLRELDDDIARFLAHWRCSLCRDLAPEELRGAVRSDSSGEATWTGLHARHRYERRSQLLALHYSKPCPHGATLDDLRAYLPVPALEKRPKHLRAALEAGITAGLFRAYSEGGSAIRFIAKV